METPVRRPVRSLDLSVRPEVEERVEPKLYVLHDSAEWMESWRPALDRVFPDGYEEWLLDGRHQQSFDMNQPPPQGVFFCKCSGSSHRRGLVHAKDFALAVLHWLEFHGRHVVNGEKAFNVETSKVRQLVAMANFGFGFPKAKAVFSTEELVQQAAEFLTQLGPGAALWIRFNLSGCGRGACLCRSAADVCKFVLSGHRSPDSIYVLQEHIDVPGVVRVELVFGQPMYGLEITNTSKEPTTWAPCGCAPLELGCAPHTTEPHITPAKMMAGCALSALLSGLAARMRSPALRKLRLCLLALAALVALYRRRRRAPPKALCAPPAKLLPVADLVDKYPELVKELEKAKLLMSDLGAATLALDVVVAGGAVTVLDLNINSNYYHEKEAGLLFEQTAVGRLALELATLVRVNQAPQLDFLDMPSENMVFGIGLPRTGTHSLAEGFKALGYRGRAKGLANKHPTQYVPKARKFSGHFDVDTSHHTRYQELFQQFPTARFVLTTRADADWQQSIRRYKGTQGLPTPTEYLSEVLRWFVNHHATHRLMVCNLFSEADELLWSKFVSFLGRSQLPAQPFPRSLVGSDGRISRAVDVLRAPGGPLLADFAASDESTVAAGPLRTPGSRSQKHRTPSPAVTPHRTPSASSLFSDGMHSTKSCSEADSEASQAQRVLSRYLDYSRTFLAEYVARPDNAAAHKLELLSWERLTPAEYDRTIFHLSLRVEGTQLAGYDAGDSIGVHPLNPAKAVRHFMDAMQYDPEELLELPDYFAGARDGTYVMSSYQLLTQFLDLFGVPTREFYKALAKRAKDIVEKEFLAELTLPRKSELFQARFDAGETFASTILAFSSLEVSVKDLLNLVPMTKPRLYSIASSPKLHAGEVHLLAVTHDWQTAKGEARVGLCTGYLEQLDPRECKAVVCGLVRSPVLKLPADTRKPVVMVGMGTGMAPFKGFVEERHFAKRQGERVGEMRLYFGARHERSEFLYRDQLESYAAEGWLKLRCAWSRDQKQKVYVQHHLSEDAELLWAILKPEAGGHFYLCGPVTPLADVEQALNALFAAKGVPTYLDELKATGRFCTEVY